MEDIETIFKNKKPVFDKLNNFGFIRNNEGYVYNTSIMDDRFTMSVMIEKTGNISSKIIDKETNEEYVLHRVLNASGNFVEQIRKEYINVLKTIDGNCFETSVFNGSQSCAVIDYAKSKYESKLEFLWPKFPDAILRRNDNHKWYAVLFKLPKEKIGFIGGEEIEIIDVRITPEKMETIIDGEHFLPGYHMNKKHWLTIVLDGFLDDSDLFSYLDESYRSAWK